MLYTCREMLEDAATNVWYMLQPKTQSCRQSLSRQNRGCAVVMQLLPPGLTRLDVAECLLVGWSFGRSTPGWAWIRVEYRHY